MDSDSEHVVQKMEKLSLDLDDGSSPSDQEQANPECPGLQEARKLSVQRCIDSLVHACQCHDANCLPPSCRKMKQVIQHSKICTHKTNGGCNICKQLIALCCYHAKHCLAYVGLQDTRLHCHHTTYADIRLASVERLCLAQLASSFATRAEQGSKIRPGSLDVREDSGQLDLEYLDNHMLQLNQDFYEQLADNANPLIHELSLIEVNPFDRYARPTTALDL